MSGLKPLSPWPLCCHPEPFAVTLSEAKGLQFRSDELMQILRFAQNDRLLRVRGDILAL